MCKFKSAAPEDSIVYGASAPGWEDSNQTLLEYINFLKRNGIERVCVLLSHPQLEDLPRLMSLYEEHFGSQNVLHAPIPDHHLPSVKLVHEHILPFLRNAKEQNEPVVVHCQAGIGRTGVVLAAWLVDEYDYDVESAIEVVKSRYRNPLDAVERNNSTFDEIENVLIGPLDEENDSE